MIKIFLQLKIFCDWIFFDWKTFIVTKLNNLNCDNTQNWIWDQTQTFLYNTIKKLKLWQIVTKLKTQIVKKKTQKLKLQLNLKTQIVTKLKNLICDKTKKNQILTKLNKIKLWQN